MIARESWCGFRKAWCGGGEGNGDGRKFFSMKKDVFVVCFRICLFLRSSFEGKDGYFDQQHPQDETIRRSLPEIRSCTFSTFFLRQSCRIQVRGDSVLR